MSETPSLNQQIQTPFGRIFHRCWVKRRLATTGLFESSWTEVTSHVERWGRIKRSIDSVQQSKFKFGEILMRFSNTEGLFNPNDDEASLWYGYAHVQRSLVKIEAGFVHQTQGANGIWTNTEFPAAATAFVGIISGDMPVSDDNTVSVPVKPLMQVFQDFPAANLTDWTGTGMTAQQLLTMIRDQTAGVGNYVFRPFFQDTTTYWNFTGTGVTYPSLNTSTAEGVQDKSVWEVIEKLAEAEDMVPSIKPDGTFRFGTRDPNTSAAAFKFFGVGFIDTEYGHTIKRIKSYGPKITNYYSRVEVNWLDANTTSAIRVRQATLAISGVNDVWNLGYRTFKLENFWIATTTIADTIAAGIFARVANLPNEIEFTTSFIPHLDILDRVEVSYDASNKALTSLWDAAEWAFEDTSTVNDMIWDASKGDAIRLVSKPFKLLSVEIDLDKLESNFIGIAL